MRNDTPPASPYSADIGDDNSPHNHHDDEDDDDDELIYVGNADEVLDQWESELAAENGADDEDDDDEFLNQIQEENEDDEGTASAAIQPERDDAILTFRGHSGAVFCGSLHTHEDLAVTGGEDDRAFVWSTETGDVVHEVTGHTDTIIAAQFSPDGKYLAIGDMAGEIEVLKLSANYQRIWEFSMGDMVWMKWHTDISVLLAGSESGEVYVWRMPRGDCKVFQSSGHRAETGTLSADGAKLVVGYGDGSIRMWDIKSSTCVQEILADSPMGHTESVTCIATDPDNGTFLSGSEDGKMLIGGLSGPLGVLSPDAGAVESLAYCKDSDIKLAACGTLTGKVSLWDIGKRTVRVECENIQPSGVTRMLWAAGHNLVCSTLDGCVKCFDGLTGRQKVRMEFFYFVN